MSFRSKSLVLAAATVAFGALATLSPLTARASPYGEISCFETTYYSSPQKTEVVGVYGKCPGGELTGKGEQTPWFRVKSIPAAPANPVTINPPGSLPCEFLVTGCSNLPVPHH